MATITDMLVQTLKEATGSCNALTAESYVSTEAQPFSYTDVAAIQDAYFGGEGKTAVHMSDFPGKICWKNLGAMENRKMVSRLAATCEKVLEGEGAAEKCEAISQVIHQMPIADPELFSAEGAKHYGQEVLKWSAGAFGVWLIFGPGLHYYNRWVNRQGPPDGPSAGAGASASGETASAPSAAPSSPPVAEARVVTRAYRDYWRHRDSGDMDDPIGNTLITLPLGLVSLARSGAVLTAEAIEEPLKFAVDKLIRGAMELAF